MGLNTQNITQISFKKLNGKAHTQQNFALTEEGISTNVQLSTHTIFADKIESLPVTNSGLTTLYSTNGVVERVKFEIDLIPDTLIGTNQSQGYKLKLPSNYTTLGKLRGTYSGGTYLYTALGRLQIVPSFFGTLKPDGTTEYDPILYQTNGSTIINKFSPINWFFDPYDGILFVQDPPISFDISASRPGFLEAFLYVGNYTDDLLTSTISGVTGTTAVNVGSGVGIFKQKLGEIIQLKSLVGTNGIGVSGTTNNVVLSYTGSTGVTITANNGLTRSGNNIHLGGTLTGDTIIDLSTKDLILKFGASPSKLVFTGSTGFNGNIDLAHSRFILGNNCQATGGSINYTFGDTNVNAGTFGAVLFGEVSEIAPGVGSALGVGENVYISGYGGIAFGRGTKASGSESFIGGRYVAGIPAKTNPKAPQSNAIGAFGWYITDTNQINNHGGNATAGAILGGRNHNIPTGSDFSAIIGGDGIKAATGITNTVYLPKVRIGQGLSATLTTGSTSPDVLVRNQTTGEIEITKIVSPSVTSNNFVFGTGTGIGKHTSQYTGDENVLVVMTQTPPTINGGTNINNVFVLGEDITLNGAPTHGGTVTDTGIFGFGHTVGDGISFFGGSTGFVYGNSNFLYGNASLVGGKNARSIGNYSAGGAVELGAVAIGLTTPISGSEPVTAYRNGINISSNSTGQTTGHGSYGSLSVILGGQDHNIPTGTSNNAIIGGDRIKASAGISNTVYLPKVRIGQGLNANLVTGSASTDFLVRNPTTGEIEISSGVVTGGTGSSTTASNGLTKVGSDIQLGGSLSADTVINAGSSQFKIDASSGTGNSFEMASWGGFLMNTQQQYIITAELPSASQGFFVGVRDGDAGTDFSNQLIIKSPSGGSTTTSGDGVNAIVITPNTITNDIRTALTLVRSSFTTPVPIVAGYGVSMDFFIDQNNSKKSNISYSFTDVTNGFEQGVFGFSLHKSGNITNILNLDGHGAKYVGDYSSGFTKYSLVDVNYVTGLTSGSSSVSAGNGLTKSGNIIKLGGTLTGNTTIDLTGKTLTIGGTAAGKTNQLNISNGGGFSLTSTGAASSEINLYTANGATHSQIDIVPAQITIDTPKIELAGASLTVPTSNSIATKSYVLGTKTFTGSQTLRTGSATAGTFPLQYVSGALLTTPVVGVEEFLADKKYFTITTGTARKEYALNDIALTSGRVPLVTTNGRLTDSTGLTFTIGTGLKYGADYSANFTARSIVDKAFVTGLTSNLSPQNVYGAKVVITASTTLNSTNFVVFCNTSISGFTVTLPSAPVDGQVYKIKDTGSGLTHNVTINGNGKNIDGSSTALINTNFGGIEVCYDSALNAWFIVNFVG